MAYCVKCGAKVKDGTMICPQCGAQIPALPPESYQTQSYSSYGSADYFDQNDVRQNKGMGVLSYIGILVFIPILAGDKGLVLVIFSVLAELLDGKWVWGMHSIIHFDGGIFSWGLEIIKLIIFVLFIMGIVSACKGTRKELPIVGRIRFFK